MSSRLRLALILTALSTLAACAPRAGIAPLPELPFRLDTAQAQRLAPGVTHRYLYSPDGPWAINVLDARLDECTRLVAVKDADVAAGRIRTSDMLRHVSAHEIVIGGVNGDFFALGDGTPTNLLVVDGRRFTPPNAAGVLAVDSAGIVHIGHFTLAGDALEPFHPRDAVGGKPIIVRDSAIVAGIDSANGAAFSRTHHPRTAVGISRDGRRVIFVVVDGRQKPYSDGMSLRQLATLMLSLGARTAMNLDGGGSSAMIFADPAANGALRIANRPSDKEGERGVGDALALVQSCVR
ncbi:MAG: phosphodiester glycosidase family protein [Gemmatimonadota bacterium]|nr:phosphodiester glycosidase family protein [Gemmatimonadota bacterium]